MTGPITPAQAAKSKLTTIPEEVFEVVNALISQNLSNNRATIKQDDIVSALVARGLNKNELFAKGWMDFEPAYRKAGWEVVYDKPGYNESGFAVFKFAKRG